MPHPARISCSSCPPATHCARERGQDLRTTKLVVWRELWETQPPGERQSETEMARKRWQRPALLAFARQQVPQPLVFPRLAEEEARHRHRHLHCCWPPAPLPRSGGGDTSDKRRVAASTGSLGAWSSHGDRFEGGVGVPSTTRRGFSFPALSDWPPPCAPLEGFFWEAGLNDAVDEAA